MALVKPDSLQKHPIACGLLWAGLTVAIICLVQYSIGRPLPNLLIAIPIWAAAGVAWGYAMKWNFDRKAGRQ